MSIHHLAALHCVTLCATDWSTTPRPSSSNMRLVSEGHRKKPFICSKHAVINPHPYTSIRSVRKITMLGLERHARDKKPMLCQILSPYMMHLPASTLVHSSLMDDGISIGFGLVALALPKA